MGQPRFGPAGNSDSFYAEGYKHTKQAPAWVKKRGLSAYEYQAGNGVTGSDDTFRQIGAEAAANGILLFFHAPYFISLSGTSEETRMKSVEIIKKSLNAAFCMGADRIVIHTGSAGKISRSEAMALAADTLAHVLAECPDNGIRLCLETMGKINQLGTLDEVLTLCQIDKRLRPTVDFGHLNAREHGGVFKTCDDYLAVFDAVDHALGSEAAETLHCHFSKIEYSDGGEKKHLTFADTVFGPDFEPLCEAIRKENLSPRIICESSGTMAEDAAAMCRYYESLC